MNILGSAANGATARTHRQQLDTAVYTEACVVSNSFNVRFGGFFFGLVLVPFLFWTTLFASWGSVGFVSALCKKHSAVSDDAIRRQSGAS